MSVRTIQRIETGEVLPRVSTIRILLAAMGEDYESFSRTIQTAEVTQNSVPTVRKNILLTAALSGVIYLVAQIILGIMNIIWLTKDSTVNRKRNGSMCASPLLLEIVTGCLLATVILFFTVYIIMVPAVVLEIIVLYRGYEYLSRVRS